MSYEVVLSNGQIVEANANENSDLWIALRGGSNNFGIVTKFSFATFSQALMWGGFTYSDISTAPQQIEAFSNFSTNPNYDKHASLIQIYGYGSGQYIALNSIVYTRPVVNPPVFQQFTSIQPQFFNNLRISTHGDFTNNTNGAGFIGL